MKWINVHNGPPPPLDKSHSSYEQLKQSIRVLVRWDQLDYKETRYSFARYNHYLNIWQIEDTTYRTVTHYMIIEEPKN